MPDIIKRMFGGVDDAANELARLRAAIEATKVDITAEESRPAPLAEIERRVERSVAHLRSLADRVSVSDLVAAEGGPLGEQALATLPPHVIAAIVAPGPLAAWLRERALATAARMGEPVDAATRAKRVAELKAKLDRLERDEAELMWSADERGLELPWRPDLDPVAALGLEPA